MDFSKRNKEKKRENDMRRKRGGSSDWLSYDGSKVVYVIQFSEQCTLHSRVYRSDAIENCELNDKYT